MNISVWQASLVRAAHDWENQSEVLNGARKSLSSASPSLLGSRVAPAATAFLTAWTEQLGVLRRRAALHADALDAARIDILGIDRLTAEQARSLLPWDQRPAGQIQQGA